MENSMVVAQKIKNRITIRWSNSTSEYAPERTKSSDSKRDFYTQVHSSTIHNSQKVETTQCLSADKWKNKLWQTHPTEYDSALNRKELLTQAATWMNLKDVTLSEMSVTRGQTSYVSTQMRYRLFKSSHYATLPLWKTCTRTYFC